MGTKLEEACSYLYSYVASFRLLDGLNFAEGLDSLIAAAKEEQREADATIAERTFVVHPAGLSQAEEIAAAIRGGGDGQTSKL